MPIYEYQCEACKHKLEIIQKISDEPMRFCPECGEETLRKLISPVSFRLKGTGWYETDFKTRKKTGEESTADVKKEGASEKPAEKKTEAKTTPDSSGSKTVDSSG